VFLEVARPLLTVLSLGRITKVLSMKPMEFLGMIEEAAGTKMYDEKKEEAIREMDKKQRKVDEITKVLFGFPPALPFE